MFSDVFLRDAQLFLHTKFYRESVCVTASFALHLEALHRLEATESVLDTAGKYMMNAWMAVCRWRSFVEDERGTTLSFGHTQMEHIFLVPLLEHFLVHIAQVELISFCEFLAHIVYFVIYFSFGVQRYEKVRTIQNKTEKKRRPRYFLNDALVFIVQTTPVKLINLTR